LQRSLKSCSSKTLVEELGENERWKKKSDTTLVSLFDLVAGPVLPSVETIPGCSRLENLR
jgi:hypothetical protein